MSQAEAVALVRRIIDTDHAGGRESNDWLERLDRAPVCPTGHAGGLTPHPKGPEPSAEDVVARALAYEPFAM
ncbi:e9imm peptide [Streptomyces sp. S1A]|uniref:e9imm peptide n=1 Tax=Streptomyces sp. ICN903 TaxID=2964654 RepID=UPI001EDA672F|nr:e9imm peptide [Streptomyces sp. ICN903]MCG3039790.1 e9imm peptide [Streptomyces sp. ICN903]